MRALIQRVSSARVEIDKVEKDKIDRGVLVLLGIEDADDDEDISWLSGKIARLRIFDDEAGVMNKSVMEVDGETMVISQFTLHASTKKGNRPSYIKASKPDIAIPLYEKFIAQLEKDTGKRPARGVFGADMKISLCNDGPVTIMIDSKQRE